MTQPKPSNQSSQQPRSNLKFLDELTKQQIKYLSYKHHDKNANPNKPDVKKNTDSYNQLYDQLWLNVLDEFIDRIHIDMSPNRKQSIDIQCLHYNDKSNQWEIVWNEPNIVTTIAQLRNPKYNPIEFNKYLIKSHQRKDVHHE